MPDDRNDPMGAMLGASAFPEQNSVGARWDAAVAKVNARNGFAPAAPAALNQAPQPGAPAGGPATAASPSAPARSVDPLSVNMTQLGRKFDVADLLTGDAHRKLSLLREKAEDARSAYLRLDESYQHWRMEKIKAEQRLLELTDPDVGVRWGGRHFARSADRISNDGTVPYEGEDPAIAIQRQTVTRATAEYEALDKRREALAHRQNEALRLVELCERYLADARASLAPSATFPAFSGKLKKFGGIETARAEIERLREALNATFLAPFPSALIRAKAKAEVERLAEQGRPGLIGALRHGADIAWPTTQASVLSHQAGGWVRGNSTVLDALAVTAWIWKDQLLAAINAEVDAIADDTNALSDEQRNARLAQLSDDLLMVERSEVALVEATIGADHRPDVDCRALLGIDGPAPVEH